MEKEHLVSLLATLTGHLHTTSPEEEQLIYNLQQTVANTLLQQDASLVTNQEFSFQSSDIFFTQNVKETRLSNIQQVVQGALATKIQQPDLRLFVRDVPIRSTQVTGSVPPWAAGARVSATYGPFIEADGRRVWFDFYKIEKLIGLYLLNQSAPAILFNASFTQRRTGGIVMVPQDAAKKYTVVKGSVWIKASLFTNTAPADRYCGLQVSGGTIELDALPQTLNGKLVINANNNVKVHLNLVQSEPETDGTGDYGKDARDASFNLPSSFAFSFKTTSAVVTALAEGNWNMYGQEIKYAFSNNNLPIEYDASISRLLIPVTSSEAQFSVNKCFSPFNLLNGTADISKSFWALSAAILDVQNPLQANGNGAYLLRCKSGVTSKWNAVDGNGAALHAPSVLGEPGRIGITDLQSDASGAGHQVSLWKDEDNQFGTTVHLLYRKGVPFIYNCNAKGDEMLLTLCNADVKTDRPVKVNGEAVAVRSKSSLIMLAASAAKKIMYLYDDNIIWDHKLPANKTPIIKPISLALENALFTTTPVNGCLLFGECNDDFTKMTEGNLLLSFGMYSYLPTLPDPYLANIGILRRQFEQRNIRTGAVGADRQVWLWLVAKVNFKPVDDELDDVKVSFHFGNMATAMQAGTTTGSAVASGSSNPMVAVFSNEQNKMNSLADAAAAPVTTSTTFYKRSFKPPDYQKAWDDKFGNVMNADAFALLDVSSNANQLGISFSMFGGTRMGMVHTSDAVNTNANSGFPFGVQEMSVVARGSQVRAFMLPIVAWEPLINLSGKVQPMDPVALWNYYPNDGGPTRIFNNSELPVALAPLPLTTYIFQQFNHNNQNRTVASFTLPFGIHALAFISKQGTEVIKPVLEKVDPTFKNNLQGGLQIKAKAGNYDVKPAVPPGEKDSHLFPGYVIQVNNVIGWDGSTGASTLGDSVTRIFNNEFFETPLAFNSPQEGRGVPVTRIDFSGYGASMFSDWLSPSAQFAATSQARFDVMIGRTAHEVIQVKSLIYPWGIRVVRTITIFRVSSGYIYRIDSGWKAESDGKFDFQYRYIPEGTVIPSPPAVPNTQTATPYEIHPGLVKGLFNVQNIVEDSSIQDFTMDDEVKAGDQYVDGITGVQKTHAGASIPNNILCRPVWFDADIEIENVVSGHVNGRVPSKKVLGYVQLEPTGVPIKPEAFKALLNEQFGSIGGPIDCVIDITNSNQQMRLNRFDVNVSANQSNDIAFAAAIRGNVFLPKDGSWSIVKHNVGTGDVTPLPESVTVPVIRKGKWLKDVVIDPQVIDKELARIAHPMELARNPVAETNNFAFLQTTATQKALFLNPSYANGTEMLLSKTPPVFADAYRLMSGIGIFPNIGNAVDNFGKAMPIFESNGVKAFTEKTLADGTKVLELLKVDAVKQGKEAIQQGMSMLQKGANGVLNKALDFDVPQFEIPLVDMEGLKIYIDYKTGKKDDPPGNYVNSKLKFDVNSFANDMADQWKSRLNNVAMVVDLGDFKRLMTIKGNFDAGKGKESGYAGDTDGQGGMNIPEIEFSEELQPLIDLLQMLASLSSGDYGETLKRGLKIAMSNSGEIWEYKFEAKKDIPLVRFPPSAALYNDPNCPLKLEASLGLGVYFNAALKVTTDPKQLLPTAGAYLQFHGGLSVMCFSVSVGTIYAVGAVDVKIACDTSVGPNLTLMFGFGAQIVVGLPVIGNVSVLYMIGVEMYADVTTFSLTGIMLFRGQANLIGGLVCVTITMEARGTVERSGSETNCSVQVTFALDISIFLVIDISFSKTWGEQRQIA